MNIHANVPSRWKRERWHLLVLTLAFLFGLTGTATPVAAAADAVPVAWGSGEGGALGNGGPWSQEPKAVDATGVLADKNVTSVSAGDRHTCAVADGKVFCWGANNHGQLGNNTDSDSTLPVAVDSSGVLAGRTVTQVSAGGALTCAVADGRAFCWGWGLDGQLGNNAELDSPVPVAVDASGVLAGKTVTQVSAGGKHACAVASGKAHCWGDSGNRALGNDESGQSSSVPVAVNTTGVLAGKTVTAITASSLDSWSFTEHSCAIADGQAYCWGANNHGQLGNNTSGGWSALPVAVDTGGVLAGKTVTALSITATSSCAVASTKVYCWGIDSIVPVAVDNGTLSGKTITGLSTGKDHRCAVSGGGAYCWGQNSAGELGDGGTVSSVVPTAVVSGRALAGKTMTSVSAGYMHTCAVADAKAFCWGNDGSGQLGRDRKIDSLVPVQVESSGVLAGKTVTSIDVGFRHACTVADGAVYCWGDNWSGQLGVGPGGSSSVPEAVSSSGVLAGMSVTQVSSGSSHTCAVAGGKAFCWGYDGSFDEDAPLGDGTWNGSHVPVAVDTSGVLAGKNLSVVSAGTGHTCAVAGGKAFCWGQNWAGQLGDNSTTGSPAPLAVSSAGALAGRVVSQISAGDGHTCVVADGKAYCWGENAAGQLGNDATADSLVPVAVDVSGVLSGKTVTAVSTGTSHSCVVADGKAYCWGENAAGQLGNDATADSLVPVAVDVSGVLSGKTVTAVAAGESHTVALTGQSAPLTTPDAPTGVSGTAGDGQVSVSWTGPSSDGGSPILEYQATASPGGNTCTTGGASSCVISGLSNGQGYTFTVRARNAQGWSEPSAASAVVTPKTAAVSPPPVTPPPANQPPVSQPPVLSAPPAVSGVKAVVRKGKVTVTWKLVSGASSYRVRISKPGGKKYLAWKKVTSTRFVAKVVKGKKYRLQIVPVGAVGQGPVKTVTFKGR